MDQNISTISCNLTANFSEDFSSCPQQNSSPMVPLTNPYEEFYKFAFGSAIFMIIVSFITIVANSLLLLVFFFDPLKIFRNTTTYFLVGLAVVDISTAVSQEPMYASCFILMYIKHPETLTTCTPLLRVGERISMAAMNASFLIVLAFTVTQYIVVISPLNHAQKVTKTHVIICVLAICAYAILFSVLPEMGVPNDVQRKIDNIFHSIILVYLTIIVYILLYVAFKKKMAASRSLRETKNTSDGGNDGNQTRVERKFITVNFLLIAILFLSSQPSAMLWIVRLFSKEDPNSPRVLIVNLMVDNLLYLKFLLDPFVYAWRIPKYRQALKIVLCCGREESDNRSKFSSRGMPKMSKSRDTIITLDFKSISQD